MDYPQVMGLLQDVADLQGNLDRTCRQKWAFTRQCFRKGHTLDKLHDDEVAPVRKISGVKNHGCMLMAQFRHGPCFTKEPVGNIPIGGKLRFDDLNGDRPFQAEMGGTVHSTHAARSNHTLDTKSAGDKLRDVHTDLLSG
jgi:hypothetical protein